MARISGTILKFQDIARDGLKVLSLYSILTLRFHPWFSRLKRQRFPIRTKGLFLNLYSYSYSVPCSSIYYESAI